MLTMTNSYVSGLDIWEVGILRVLCVKSVKIHNYFYINDPNDNINDLKYSVIIQMFFSKANIHVSYCYACTLMCCISYLQDLYLPFPMVGEHLGKCTSLANTEYLLGNH